MLYPFARCGRQQPVPGSIAAHRVPPHEEDARAESREDIRGFVRRTVVVNQNLCAWPVLSQGALHAGTDPLPRVPHRNQDRNQRHTSAHSAPRIYFVGSMTSNHSLLRTARRK